MAVEAYGEDRLHQVYSRDRAYSPAEAGEPLYNGFSSEPVRRGGGAKGERRQEDLGISGDQTGIFGSRSSPYPSGGRQSKERLAASPPTPGQHPSFDAKVAAEFLRLRNARDSSRDSPTNIAGDGGDEGGGGGGGGGGQGGAPAADAFESDVERAMRNLEARLTAANGEARGRPGSGRGASPVEDGGARICGSRYSTLTSRPSPPPAVLTRPELPDRRTGGDEGILSQMDMHSMTPGGGKGKPGGLRDMWNDGRRRQVATLPGGERRQQRQRGGGLAGMWQQDGKGSNVPDNGGATPFLPGHGRCHSSVQQMQRQGPGLKGMWDGDDPADTSAPSLRPQRQGPGLRGLWSGPDMAAADIARSEAQAEYFRALNRDVEEKRAYSENMKAQQQQQQQQQQARDRLDGVNPLPGVSGRHSSNGAGEQGTSLAGIGTPRGEITSRHRRRESSERGDGGGSADRAFDRAKKAAYAEELRKQMAEKEARTAMDENGPAVGRRRASTVGRGGGDGGTGGYNRGRESYPGQSLAGNSVGPPSPSMDPSRDDCWPSAAWLTPPTGGSGVSGGDLRGPAVGSEGQVSAARRRLVEDVYGGGGMEAALGGMGYRRASTGSCGVGGAGARPRSATGIETVRGGVGEARAAVGVVGAAASGASSFLRTGAGVQSLRESEHDESKWQKRAAALEQQRALEEQITAKAGAKKEEEDERKREEEEESRQQQERLRQIEADAEEARRRKQAEQQQQLQGLYRQQEEALRKKRGGGVGRRKHVGDGDYSRAPAFGGSTPIPDDSSDTAAAAAAAAAGYFPLSGGGGGGGGGGGVGEIRQSQIKQRGAVDLVLPPDGGGDIGSNIGGRQTPRHRSSILDVDDLPAGAQARAQVLRSSPPYHTTAGIAAPSPSSWRPGSARSGGGSGLVSNGRRGSGRPPAANGCFDEGADLEADASAADEFPGRGRTTRTTVFADDPDGAPGPPLQTRSTLVPLSSPILFPPFPGDTDTDDAQAPLAESATPRLAQQSFGGSGARRDRVAEAATAAAAAAAANGVDPPQDEMDAFVTKWQVEHLRRRGHQEQGQQQGGRKTGESGPHQASSPGGGTVYASPSRNLRRSLRASGSRGRGVAGPGGKAGELEESLAATSRMVNPPSLRRPPGIYDGRGVGGEGGTTKSPRPARLGGEEEGASNVSEQSLTSDSILFYLSGQQHESIAASPPVAGAADRTSIKSGRMFNSGVSGIRPSRLGFGRQSSGLEVGDSRDCGWESANSVAGGGAGARPSTWSSPGRGSSTHREGDDGGGSGCSGDRGQMSPLTRLLAETPVRLNTPGSLRLKREVDSTAHRFGSDPQAYRLDTGDNNNDSKTSQEALSQGGSTPWSSHANNGSGSGDSGVAAVPRRARALWGHHNSGRTAAAEETEGVTFAEGLMRRGGGVPWEDMPMSEATVSSSVPPPHL